MRKEPYLIALSLLFSLGNLLSVYWIDCSFKTSLLGVFLPRVYLEFGKIYTKQQSYEFCDSFIMTPRISWATFHIKLISPNQFASFRSGRNRLVSLINFTHSCITEFWIYHVTSRWSIHERPMYPVRLLLCLMSSLGVVLVRSFGRGRAK